MAIKLNLPFLVFVVVMLCWFAFAAIFFFRKQPERSPDRKRDPASIYGLVLQGLSYAIVWSWRREPFSPVLSGRNWLSFILEVLAIVASIASVWFIMWAVKTLGKEWSLSARLVEGHKLATTGPYRVVRHPIYTGMLGMLLATGIAISGWPAIVVAVTVFLVGTIIRMRSEEKLLREAFGPDFENYSQTVPAIIPGVY
jgi:protein-S-isoprenylcysteine O-methyltransferase Ste14